jgi:hypothetical protein
VFLCVLVCVSCASGCQSPGGTTARTLMQVSSPVQPPRKFPGAVSPCASVVSLCVMWPLCVAQERGVVGTLDAVASGGVGVGVGVGGGCPALHRRACVMCVNQCDACVVRGLGCSRASFLGAPVSLDLPPVHGQWQGPLGGRGVRRPLRPEPWGHPISRRWGRHVPHLHTPGHLSVCCCTGDPCVGHQQHWRRRWKWRWRWRWRWGWGWGWGGPHLFPGAVPRASCAHPPTSEVLPRVQRG